MLTILLEVLRLPAMETCGPSSRLRSCPRLLSAPGLLFWPLPRLKPWVGNGLSILPTSFLSKYDSYDDLDPLQDLVFVLPRIQLIRSNKDTDILMPT